MSYNLPGPFTAWQLIGWEGDCGELRRVGGRKLYCLVNYYCDTARSNNVRLVAPAGEGDQYVGPDTRIEIVSITRAGWEFLVFQDLVPMLPAEPLMTIATAGPVEGKPQFFLNI